MTQVGGGGVPRVTRAGDPVCVRGVFCCAVLLACRVLLYAVCGVLFVNAVVCF